MSVNIWNATEQKLNQVGGNVNINDSVTSADSTWSSEKINDSLVDLENEVGNVYSTEETVCGKWIDGKKIYRKVFYSESSAFTQATQFQAPYAEKLVEYSTMYRDAYDDFFPYSAKLYNKGQANAYFQIPTPSYGAGTYWIAMYTKTTD